MGEKMNSEPKSGAGGAGHDGVILFVDDEEALREVGRLMLAREGYEVVPAASGEEAVAIYGQRDDIELIILDLTMPGMGGEECLRTIVGMDSEAKVILVSGSQPGGEPSQVYGSAVKAFMTKPVRRLDLVALVAKALDG